MTRIFTILQKYIFIKLKKLDNSNSANPQVAWANLDGLHILERTGAVAMANTLSSHLIIRDCNHSVVSSFYLDNAMS